MLALPVCRHRRCEEESIICMSTHLQISDPKRHVYKATCRSCKVADLPDWAAPPPIPECTPSPSPPQQASLDGAAKLQTCIHAGRAIRGKTELCQSCGGAKSLQVFACAKIGETHAGKCGPCQLYEPKLP